MNTPRMPARTNALFASVAPFTSALISAPPGGCRRSTSGAFDRVQQGLDLGRAIVTPAVDEERRRPVHPAADSAREVLLDPGEVNSVREFDAKAVDVETQSGRALDQVL